MTRLLCAPAITSRPSDGSPSGLQAAPRRCPRTLMTWPDRGTPGISRRMLMNTEQASAGPAHHSSAAASAAGRAAAPFYA
jgi:hypothetical protein